MDLVLTLPRGRPLTEDDLRASAWTSALYEVVDESLVVSSAGAPFSRGDLDRLLDDGWRHELIDGCLVMTPAPSVRHQRIVPRLWRILTSACPTELEVLMAPLDVAVSADGDVDRTQVFQPDVLVARTADLTATELPAAPVLAVEVLSPSTRTIDLRRKFAAYEAAGVASYWVIDQDGPHLTAWDLRDGVYVLVAEVGPDQTWTASLPFDVTVCPGDLVP